MRLGLGLGVTLWRRLRSYGAFWGTPGGSLIGVNWNGVPVYWS